MPAHRLAQLLTLAGALPLFLALIIEVEDGIWFGATGGALAHSYGVMIVSFLAGTHWGIYLFFQGRWNLFLLSALLALAAWMSLLALGNRTGLAILVCCFAFALFVDLQSRRDEIIPAWFWRLRIQITGIVIALLLMTAVAA